MRIGFLITYFYPQTGGAENNCYYTAKELAKKHEVHVFCSGKEEKEEVIDGIFVHRCRELFRVKYYFAFYSSLAKKLLSYDLDVLHLHGFGFLQHELAVRKLKKEKPNLKVVCTPHGPFMALKKYNVPGKIFKGLYMPFLRKAIRMYDAVIQVNPLQYKWMTKEYGILKNKIYFVPNGITENSFIEIDEPNIAKHFGLEGRFVISYLGRIQKYKGLEQIIRVLPALKKANGKVLFLAIGKDAGDEKRVQEIASELKVDNDVVFTGEVSERDKLALLDISKIFVFPSEWEAFGIAMLEAMARGNAVVSSKTEGGIYLIKEGKNGYLYKYGNLKGLEKALIKIIKNPRIRKRMGSANIKKAKEFLWKSAADKLESIYLEIIK